MKLSIEKKVYGTGDAIDFLRNIIGQMNRGHKSGEHWSLEEEKEAEKSKEDTDKEVDKKPDQAESPAEKPKEEAKKVENSEQKKGPDGKYPWEKNKK